MIQEKDLKPGECICSKCLGKCEIRGPKDLFSKRCPKCLGEGKVDWVTNAMQYKRSTDEYQNVLDEMIKYMSQVMSDKIDKEIIGSIYGNSSNEKEHIVNVKINTAVANINLEDIS